MRKIIKLSLGLIVAFGAVGCAVVPVDDGYYAPQVTVVAPAPRYYVAPPPPRYYVVPGRPHYRHHGGEHRRW